MASFGTAYDPGAVFSTHGINFRSTTMAKDLADLITRLKENPSVIGIVNYGGRRLGNTGSGGDFDIAVFVDERPEDLESIRFYWGDVPVDLSLRTFSDLDRGALDFIDPTLSQGDILLDRTGRLAERLKKFTETWFSQRRWRNEHAVNGYRYEHTHILDKTRERLESNPLLCEYLLTTNMRALLSAYYSLRKRPFPGPRAAFEMLPTEDPKFMGMIGDFFSANGLREKFCIAEELADYVLEPVGGTWKKDEILGWGTTPAAENLGVKARQTLQMLIGAGAVKE
jgi:hypothetical protein